MKCGSVVKVDNFQFLDGLLDEKLYNRSCIVLFEEAEQLCVCPVVGQLDSFNKNPQNYYLLPFTNKSGKKLTFAKLNSIVYINQSEVLEVIDYMDETSMLRLIEKIKNNYLSYNQEEYYVDTLNKIEYLKLVK